MIPRLIVYHGISKTESEEVADADSVTYQISPVFVNKYGQLPCDVVGKPTEYGGISEHLC